MPENQNEAIRWLTSQSVADLRQLLMTSPVASYEHPYGFTVVRAEESVVPAWQARVHLWPPRSIQYERMIANGVLGQQVHAHGWELYSIVLKGSLEETSYSPSFDPSYDRAVFRVESNYGTGSSRLALERLGVSVTGSLRIRMSGDGCYNIPKATFHSTVNAIESWTISLVLTQISMASSWLIADAGLKVFTNPRRESRDLLRLNELLSPSREL